MIRMLCILILLLGLQFDLCAQEKFEKEYRIKTDEVPPTALNFVEALNLNTKIRWYFEENLKGNAIEVLPVGPYSPDSYITLIGRPYGTD